jgi:hypothetical protein
VEFNSGCGGDDPSLIIQLRLVRPQPSWILLGSCAAVANRAVQHHCTPLVLARLRCQGTSVATNQQRRMLAGSCRPRFLTRLVAFVLLYLPPQLVAYVPQTYPCCALAGLPQTRPAAC